LNISHVNNYITFLWHYLLRTLKIAPNIYNNLHLT